MRNKVLLVSLLVFFHSALRVDAATSTVKAGGGGTFTTIQACANAAVAGDTCVLFAGNYNETVTPAQSGSSGSPITFSTNPGDSVTVTGWDLGTLSYIVIKGTAPNPMVITNQISWSAMNHNTFQYISNTGGTGGAACFNGNGWYSSGQPSSYNQFLNLTMSKCAGLGAGLAAGIEIEGHNNLIDGSTFTHLQSAIQLYGSNNVVRNNTFGPIAGSDLGGQHSQPIESSGDCSSSPGDLPLVHMLYENNAMSEWRGPDSHGFLLRDAASVPCGQTTNVIRFSTFINLGSNWVTNDVNSKNELLYNNSVQGMQLDFGTKDMSDLVFTHGDTGANVINNAITNSWRSGSSDYCIYLDGSSQPGFVEHNNLCFLSGWSGSWQNAIGSYAATDIFNKDPLFVNANSDLHVQAGSPAIGAGGPLTTAVGTGSSSTSLTVANAGFFSDGYGITGVQADWIRIGASTTVQISSVNYSSNVLTLASPASWSSGASIYLYKNSNGTVVLTGANPDIGAFPSGSTSGGGSGGGSGSGSQPPLPPTNVNAIAK